MRSHVCPCVRTPRRQTVLSSHEQMRAGNKVPLKLTSLNFELMAGLPVGGEAAVGQGLGPGHPTGAPHSAGALGAPSNGAGQWNPLGQGHDSFFLPAAGQQMHQAQFKMQPGVSARNKSVRQDVTQTHYQMLDPREMARNGNHLRR